MVFVLLIRRQNHSEYDGSSDTTLVDLYKTKEGAVKGAKKYIISHSLTRDRECLNNPFAKEFGNFYGGNTFKFELSNRTIKD